MKTIKTVNIIGLGALGMLYGKAMQNALGYENVNYIMDEARCERNKSNEYTINGAKAQFKMVPTKNAEPADFVMVAVKSPAMDSALETMAGSIGPETIIMSVMNGISSEDILADRFGADHMIYTVAQGMDAVKLGNSLTYSRAGELHIGLIPSGKEDNLEAVADLLARSNLAYVIEDDILYRIWSKFMLNVGINQTCMVYNTNYHGALTIDEYFRTFVGAMREVVAVANAEGIPLTEADLNTYVNIIKTLNPDLMPSMAQDRINQTPCEVEAFSGTLIKLAKKHDILIPVNEFLYKKAHEIEANY